MKNLGASLVTMMVLFISAPFALSQTPLPLNILERVNVGGTDRMTTVDISGEDCSPETCPSDGQVFYVPANQEPGTLALNRFFNGPDHLDSTQNTVPGYTLEGPNGFPFGGNSLLGLSRLYEGVNATGDHALMRQSEQLAGYIKRPLGAFGYPRFGNQTESILSLNAGGVKIESNRVSGGALWRWTWNGKQFLNNAYNQGGSFASLFLNGYTNYINENGDGCNHAPIVSALNAGTKQLTLAVPLANASLYSDKPCLHPVVWKDAVLGKEITLNFRGMGPVAQYKTVVWLPAAIPAADFYLPITSLGAEFNRYFFYDAETLQLDEHFIADACEDYQSSSPNFGGVILSDPSGQYAMGAYGVNVARGGSLSVLSLVRHACQEITFSRIDVIRTIGIPAGYSSYNAYLMTGTVQQVRGYMDALFKAGVK